MSFCLIVVVAASLAVADDAKELEKEQPTEAYWVDPQNGDRLESLSIELGTEKVIRLYSEIPDKKALKSYSFGLFLDEGETVEIVDAVKIEDSKMPPMNINLAEKGNLFANSFDVSGVESEDAISLIEITIKGVDIGNSNLSTLFSVYGSGASDQFKPQIDALSIEVE